jgi:hypothetical protein
MAVICERVPYPFGIRCKRFIFACQKLFLSFRSRTWKLSDYPIAFVNQSDLGESSSVSNHKRVKPWRAEIIGWFGPTGTGDSCEEAYAELEEAFAKALQNREHAPRPGWRVPLNIEFASSIRVDQDPVLAERFIHDVLGYEWAMITDESSLWDFISDESLTPYFEKIRECFGLDVSHIESGNLAEILEAISHYQQSVHP